MFGDAVALSYSDLLTGGAPSGNLSTIGPPPPMKGATDAAGNPISQGVNAGIVTEGLDTSISGATIRNVNDLKARIKAAGGMLSANSTSSYYLVAVNNPLKFSVTRNAAGQFEIRESQNFYYLIGAAVLIGALLLAKK